MSDSSTEDGDSGEEKPAGAGLPWEAFGSYLRAQRQLARLSLRQLAELTRISNPYLSQIERGLHQPSVAVIRALADALDLSPEDLLAQAAGLADRPTREMSTTEAIRNDRRLDPSQKRALLTVYASMVGEADPSHQPSDE
jgi:transcriptional regulator with XRE-family HTH domain